MENKALQANVRRGEEPESNLFPPTKQNEHDAKGD